MDENLSYHQKWYRQNKERHLAYLLTPIYCDCGAVVSRNHFNRHMTCKKHERWEEDQPVERSKNIKCICGGTFLKSNKIHHMKSAKHQAYLKSEI